MNEAEALEIFGSVNAIIANSHVVYTSGKHGKAYVNKDAVYPYTRKISLLCRGIAEQFADDGIEVVVAPAIGGVILSQRVAEHLTYITGREVLGTYAEQEEEFVMESRIGDIIIPLPEGTFDRENEEDIITLHKGEKLVVKKPSFIIRRGYDKLVSGKKVLGVEDILTTGGSVKKVIKATRVLDGNIIGVGVLCNRGGITAKDLDVPRLFSLVNVALEMWDENDCPLCATNVPINTSVGKGKEFLKKTGRSQ